MHPKEVELVADLTASPETEAIAFVARSEDGGFVAFETGSYELEYEDVVELAAYHLISLESEVDGTAKDIIKDVVQKRNELKERDAIVPTESENHFKRRIAHLQGMTTAR